ncbi:hypothetical protein ZIOFF_063255 [Zingiber officinale]|uniref:Uncharacterized protein n=1 Tax=Zingiber officinale TaxID=94328 RepID=A0A8J5F284_ZINOF|nr:hypothetical protein ZIOFF_063255 [Zingiber officinale]
MERAGGLGDAAGRTRLGLASISLSHYINVATLSSNVGTVDSSNDGSAVAELKANEVGHSNWQEEKVVLSRGSNPGREDGSLTREETNGSFQSKTTKVDDIQSNSWTANPRVFPLSRSASSRRSSRGKSILENHKGKLTANTSRFAREQWGRKSSSPSVSPSPRRKDSCRLQFEVSSDIGLVKRALDYSKFFPTFVATGPPVPYLVFPFGPEIYYPSHYPWDGPGRSLSINLNYVQAMGYSSRQMPVMSLQFGLDNSWLTMLALCTRKPCTLGLLMPSIASFAFSFVLWALVDLSAISQLMLSEKIGNVVRGINGAGTMIEMILGTDQGLLISVMAATNLIEQVPGLAGFLQLEIMRIKDNAHGRHPQFASRSNDVLPAADQLIDDTSMLARRFWIRCRAQAMRRCGETVAAIAILGTTMVDGGGLLPKALSQAKTV